MGLAAIVALVTVVSIGSPLVGARVFHGADVVENFAPWREYQPADRSIRRPPIGDTVDSVLPKQVEFSRRLREGDFALWNPWPAGGSPLGSTIANANIAPLNAPYLLLPDWLAPAAVKLLEMTVAIGGTYLFLRRLGLLQSAALIGGLVYVNTGFQIAWTNWPQSQIGALVPGLFWAIERFIQARDRRSAALIAIIVAAMVLEGFVAVLLFASLAAVPYLAVRLLATHRSAPDDVSGSRPRSTSRLVVGMMLAAGLGLCLAAVQLIPFVRQSLDTVNFGAREASALGRSLPESLLATAVVPNAYGSPVDGVEYSTLNYVEALSFLGVTALFLAFIGATSPGGHQIGSRVRGAFVFSTLVLVAVIYLGGPPLDLVQQLPGFDINPIGRARSILGFTVAVLAAFGFDRLLGRAGSSNTDWTRRRATLAGLCATGCLVALAVLGGRAARAARAVGETDYLVRASLLPAIVGVLAVAVVVVLVRRPALRGVAAVALVVLVGVESLNAARPVWARISREDFYPTTPAHDFLAEHLGPDRVAPAELSLYPGTTAYYRIRTVNGHEFHQAGWAEMLEAAAPDVFSRSPTFSLLPQAASTASSPLLDRMAARYWVADPQLGLLGSIEPSRAIAGHVEIAGQVTASTQIASGPLRGVVLTVREGEVSGSTVRLEVTVRDQHERIIARGWRRLARAVVGGDVSVPLDGEALPAAPDASFTIEVRLDSDHSGDAIALATGDDDALIARAVRPDDDGLRLVFTEGVAIFERERALDRVRWASAAQSVTDPGQRLRVLAAGIADEVVLLSEAPAEPSGGPGQVTTTTDDGDAIEVEAASEEGGWLVVADALQTGWEATIDGEPTELLDADHAMVAVRVPPGTHTVRLEADPPGLSTGLRISMVALVVLAILLVPWSHRATRRRIDPGVRG